MIFLIVALLGVSVVAMAVVSIQTRAIALKALRAAEANKCQAPPEPTREEKIAHLRGHIQSCKALETTLGGVDELPAKLMLAMERSKAAQAREHLRALGVEA